MTATSEVDIQNYLTKKQYEKAFNKLLQVYQERIYWQIRKMVLHHEDANDVSQNVWIKTWKGLPKYNGRSAIYTWLYRIAHNESITYLNKQRIKIAENSEQYFQTTYAKLQSDEHFKGDEIEAKLQAAIASLPPKQQAVFNMKYFEEKKYQEMADILQTSVGALKASYHHAVKKIEQFIKGN